MAINLMYIHDDDTPNYPFCRLQLVVKTFGHTTKEATNQNSIKVSKVGNPRRNVIIGLWGLKSQKYPPSFFYSFVII